MIIWRKVAFDRRLTSVNEPLELRRMSPDLRRALHGEDEDGGLGRGDFLPSRPERAGSSRAKAELTGHQGLNGQRGRHGKRQEVFLRNGIAIDGRSDQARRRWRGTSKNSGSTCPQFRSCTFECPARREHLGSLLAYPRTCFLSTSASRLSAQCGGDSAGRRYRLRGGTGWPRLARSVAEPSGSAAGQSYRFIPSV